MNNIKVETKRMLHILKGITIKKALLMIIGTLLMAIGINKFVIGLGLYSSGMTGLLMVLNHFVKFRFSTIYLIVNIPLLIFAYKKIGRKFTVYSAISVVLLSLWLDIVPYTNNLSDNILLLSIFGGIIIGSGTAMILSAGSSTAGLDVVTLLLSRFTGKSMGQIVLIINSLILLLIAAIFNVEIVLYTLVNLIVSTIVLDKLYTRYQILEVEINMKDPTNFLEEYLSKTYRGCTIFPAIGGYSKDDRNIVKLIINSYQLSFVTELIKKHDNKAFVTIKEVKQVVGSFVDNPKK